MRSLECWKQIIVNNTINVKLFVVLPSNESFNFALTTALVEQNQNAYTSSSLPLSLHSEKPKKKKNKQKEEEKITTTEENK